MSSIFITGGAGFLGRRVLERVLASSSDRVQVLVRVPERLDAALREHERLDVVQGDLLDPPRWSAPIASGACVVHLAALTGKARRAQYHEVNAEGTARLLDVAKRAQATGFLHVSSIAAAFVDKTRYHYAHSKERSEALVRESGLAHTIVRPTMILGRGAPVLAGLTKLACAFVMPVFGSGKTRIQPVCARDLARILIELVCESRFDSETIEVGGADVVAFEELLAQIRERRTTKRRRAVHLPLRLTRGVLGLLEPVALPVLPLTAGQLASFANDGVARPHPFVASRSWSLRGIAEMLDEAFADD